MAENDILSDIFTRFHGLVYQHTSNGSQQ